MDAIISEVGLLKRKYPMTNVLILGTAHTKGALFTCSAGGGKAVYYLPLK